VTSQEAADLLNVSRPYVVKLARDGVLAHHRVGNRHRFTLADVLDYRDQMRTVPEEALAEVASTDGDTRTSERSDAARGTPAHEPAAADAGGATGGRPT
jgi:excisionase family DNA binding protein